MTKNVASPKSTGGGGFLFEDKVCAWFVVHMLSGDVPLEPIVGSLTRIDFQTRPDGWFFDDLLLTTNGTGGEHRCALSIKSNTQFGVSTAPSDFVADAWAQYLHDGSAVFNPNGDFMGLVTTPLDVELRTSLDFVQSTASELNSDLLPGRYENGEWASKARRTLFESFHCPAHLAHAKGITAADTGRLVARLRFLQFDFESKISDSEKQAIERCRRALRTGDTQEASAMWNTVLQITAEHRIAAGSIDRRTLLQELQGQFRLREAPNFLDDWNRLRSLSLSNMALVRDVIGEEVRLQHTEILAALPDMMHKHGGAVLLGASGVGKSAAAKAFAQTLEADGEHILWFNASSFDQSDFAAFQATLQLTHTTQELLRSVSSPKPLIVFDGLDRLYTSSGFSLVASLIRLAIPDDGPTPWKVLLTCQTQDWERLRNDLITAGVPLRVWPGLEVKTWSSDGLAPVWKEIPGAARLRLQKKLQPLWGNLKILDLLATRIGRGSDVETAGWVGETHVATWYWQSYVRAGDATHAQERFAMVLAEKEASELRSALPIDSFEVSELGPYEGLRENGVCQSTSDSRIKFAHDLFGDWARLHILIAHSEDFLQFIETRVASPLWHRAIRLYGVYLLENRKDLEGWRSLKRSLTASGNASASDLLLEAVIFSANPAELLATLRTDLFEGDSDSLRRLLGRFLAFSTVPDARYETDGEPLSPRLTSLFRSPNWLDWPPLLKFLFENRADAIARAPVEVARIASLWFEHTSEGFRFRKEMASIGLLLGDQAYRGWRDNTVRSKNRKLFYRLAIAGAVDYPDEVAEFALLAAARGATRLDLESEPVEFVPLGVTMDPRFDPEAGPVEPWPDGPRAMVDEAFRETILDDHSLRPLMRVRPSVAREVILAVMLKKRRRFDWHNSSHQGRELDLYSGEGWSTPLYTQGPFLSFLQINFDEGLETIVRLIDFASERWVYYTRLTVDEYSRQAPTGDLGTLSIFVDKAMKPPGTTLLTLSDGDRELVGDERVYAWSGKNPPPAIGPALMALEKYFYDDLDAGRSVTDGVQLVLQRARSVAMLKVLCDVGKREPSLFANVLQPLLTVPEIYLWERKETAADRQHLLMFAFRLTRRFIHAAREFHTMPHRATDISQIAVNLFLFDASSRDFLSLVRDRWQSRVLETPEGNFRQHLLSMIDAFNVDSYRRSVDEEGHPLLVNVRAHENYAAREAEIEAQQRRLQMLTLPARARRYIDEGMRLTSVELAGLWTFLDPLYQSSTAAPLKDDDVSRSTLPPNEHVATERIASGLFKSVYTWVARFCRVIANRAARGRKIDSDASSKPIPDPSPLPSQDAEGASDEADAVLAVIALLYRQREEWLEAHPERMQWCLSRLASIIETPPPRRQFDQPDSVSPWAWDCFAAELISEIWLENPSDARLRYLLARLIFLAPHHNAITIIFTRCSKRRLDVRRDFAQLRCLIFHLANMRERMRFVQQYKNYDGVFSQETLVAFQSSVDPWARRCIGAFIDGSLPLSTHLWRETDSKSDYVDIDAIRERYLPHHMLDIELVRAAHEWLPALDEAIDNDERQEWVGFWQSALAFALQRISAGRYDQSSPYEYEQWILERVGGVLVQMHATETPQSLWKPILDLPADCYFWGELMLQSFHRVGLSQDPVTRPFESTRTAMGEYLLDAAGRSAGERWPISEDAWQALIGIDHFTRTYWSVRHRLVVTGSAALLRRWIVEIAATSFSQLAALSHWLRQDVADPMRINVLIDAYQAMKQANLFAISPRDDSGNAIALLLHTVWERDRASMRANETAFASFKELLRWLVDMQNPIALELARKVGSL